MLGAGALSQGLAGLPWGSLGSPASMGGGTWVEDIHPAETLGLTNSTVETLRGNASTVS